jgi:hypothetical protein
MARKLPITQEWLIWQTLAMSITAAVMECVERGEPLSRLAIESDLEGRRLQKIFLGLMRRLSPVVNRLQAIRSEDNLYNAVERCVYRLVEHRTQVLEDLTPTWIRITFESVSRVFLEVPNLNEDE